MEELNRRIEAEISMAIADGYTDARSLRGAALRAIEETEYMVVPATAGKMAMAFIQLTGSLADAGHDPQLVEAMERDAAAQKEPK